MTSSAKNDVAFFASRKRKSNTYYVFAYFIFDVFSVCYDLIKAQIKIWLSSEFAIPPLLELKNF